MPNVQSFANLFRQHYVCKGVYLSTPEEVPVLVATAAAPASYPIFSIGITITSGDYTLCEEDFEVEVTRAGAYVGRLRVAAGGATSTVLKVNEVSESRISVQAGDTIRVLRSIRIHDKLIGATATFPKDSRLEYSDQNENVPPLTKDGGHYAARWRGVPIPVTFYGSLTEPVDFGSNGPFTHAWQVYGPTTFSSTDEDPTFTFTQSGTYWVKHTATDTDNGASWTKWSVVVLDPNPIRFSNITVGASVDDPWALSFRALGDCGIERLPYGAMLILHEDESTGSHGNRVADRSRVKGVFFLLNESIHLEPTMGELTFTAASPLGILMQIYNASQMLEMTGATPIDWQEYELGLTTNGVLVYLARWHTTYARLFDIVLPVLNYPYREFIVEAQTPADQLKDIADAVEAFVRGDRAGALIMRQDLNLRGSTARDAADVLFHFTMRDLLQIEDLTIEHRPRVAHVLYRMFSGDAPLESESGVPSEAAEYNTVERKIGIAQDGSELSANERCGWHFALQNRTNFGKPVPVLSVTHSGAYDFLDPAYEQWMLFTGTFIVADRVYTFEAARFWLESVEILYEAFTDANGVTQYKKSIRASYVGETDGAKGTTVPVIVGDTTPPTDNIPPVYTPGTTIEEVLLYGGTRRIALACDNGLALTVNFGAGDATNYHAFYPWASIGVDGVPVDLTPSGFVLGSGWLTTEEALYFLDLAAASVGSSLFTFVVATDNRSADASFGAPGRFCVVSHENSRGIRAVYTTDGITYAESLVDANYDTDFAFTILPTCFVSSRSIGRVYSSRFTTTAPSATQSSEGQLSNDGGGSWGAMSGIMLPSSRQLYFYMHVPWHNNDAETTLFVSKIDPAIVSANRIKLMRVDGTSQTDISPSLGGDKLSHNDMRGFATFVGDSQRGLLIGQKGGDPSAFAVFRGDGVRTGSPSWLQLTPLGTPYRRGYIAGNDGRIFYFIGDDGEVGLAVDGETIVSQKGNLGSYNPGRVRAAAGY